MECLLGQQDFLYTDVDICTYVLRNVERVLLFPFEIFLRISVNFVIVILSRASSS